MSSTAAALRPAAPSRDDIAAALRSVLRPTARLVVVHSQIGAFGDIDDPAATMLGALADAMPDDATLAMPTFTFNFLSSGRFDRNKDRSETGLLTEIFRCQDGVRRSKHPIYSYALKGPDADRLAELSGATCWGDDTIFAAMEDMDADIIMLGNSWEQCTLFHRIEQKACVPYRYPKNFDGVAEFGAGDAPVSTEMLVRRLGVPVENLFSPIVDALAAEGQLRSTGLGRGLVSAAGARDILDAGDRLLAEDPLALLADKKAYSDAANRTRVALLSSANLDTFVDQFDAAAQEWLPHGARCFVPPFDQYRQEILNQDSEFYRFDPEWVFFLDRAEDVLGTVLSEPGQYGDPEAWTDAIDSRMRAYTETIHLARERSNAKTLVMNFARPANSPFGMADKDQPLGQAAAIARANEILAQDLPADAFTILDFETMAATFGHDSVTDDKFWYLGRIPFGRNFARFLSQRLTGAILALTQQTARLIVTDLDNTLWHGVIGEDGVENIGIGTDFPGNAYRDFQTALKALATRGVALAICSKNTEETALAAFTERPEMALAEDDFVARRINWTDKASNIRSIADEMALGLGSICFIDDDPHERALVRRQLPEVFVPDLPEDPASRTGALLALPCLEVLDVTSEDLRRSQQYKSRTAVESARRNVGTLEDFYRGLEMSLSFEPIMPTNQARILQLIAKTNQFNTTTRRYDASTLKKLCDEGADVLAIGLEDRFSKAEIIGVVVVTWQAERAVIDLFLLSCRVLGRSVECGILGWIAERARARGMKFVDAEIIETPRNQPVRSVYLDNNFRAAGDGNHILDLAQSALAVPEWFAVKESET